MRPSSSAARAGRSTTWPWICDPDSPSYLRWVGTELTAENGRALYVPEGCAHGFQTLEDASEILYQISSAYAPEAARGVRWDDPAFSIEWPPAPPGGRTMARARRAVSRLRAMSRILLTGATGFIGRHVLPRLKGEVHAVTTRPPPAGDSVRWHRADLLSSAEIVAEVRPEVLVHLAWYVEPGRYWTAPENIQWVEASLALLRAFAGAGGRRAVVAGTSAEYDWHAVGEPLP